MRRSSMIALATAAAAAFTGIAAGQLAIAYQQTPASPLQSGSFANINSAYSPQRVGDHFVLATNSTVSELKWSGFMYSPVSGNQVGLSNVSSFLVQIFKSDGLDQSVSPVGGAPGTLVHAETIPMGAAGPGSVFLTSAPFGPGAFSGPTFEFHAGLATPVSLTAGQTYWLAINAILTSGTSTSDVFTWMDQGASGGGTLSDGHFVVDGGSDPVDGIWKFVNGGTGGGKSFKLFAAADTDGDGLADIDEVAAGTNPNNPDTDGDGLLDGTEVDLATSGSCLDPLDPDVDGDGLLDGEEVAMGSDPCNIDTDGDGLDDWIDPDPLVSIASLDQVALAVRDLSDYLSGFDLSLFEAKNPNAAAAKRNALATLLQTAAKQLEKNHKLVGLGLIQTVRLRVDGETRPNDWVRDSEEQDRMLGYLDEFIGVINGL